MFQMGKAFQWGCIIECVDNLCISEVLFLEKFISFIIMIITISFSSIWSTDEKVYPNRSWSNSCVLSWEFCSRFKCKHAFDMNLLYYAQIQHKRSASNTLFLSQPILLVVIYQRLQNNRRFIKQSVKAYRIGVLVAFLYNINCCHLVLNVVIM